MCVSRLVAATSTDVPFFVSNDANTFYLVLLLLSHLTGVSTVSTVLVHSVQTPV